MENGHVNMANTSLRRGNAGQSILSLDFTVLVCIFAGVAPSCCNLLADLLVSEV
jgi:hypothetical protein